MGARTWTYAGPLADIKFVVAGMGALALPLSNVERPRAMQTPVRVWPPTLLRGGRGRHVPDTTNLISANRRTCMVLLWYRLTAVRPRACRAGAGRVCKRVYRQPCARVCASRARCARPPGGARAAHLPGQPCVRVCASRARRARPPGEARAAHLPDQNSRVPCARVTQSQRAQCPL